MKKLLIFLLLITSSAMLQAADIKEGVQYKKITGQAMETGDKIKVQEFFWYGCPHCYHFEPFVNAWKKTKPANVEFVRVPAIFRPDWEIQARTYYALSNMGLIEQIHIKIFDAMHKEKKRLNTKKELTDFVVANGVDREKFEKEYNSFAVANMVSKGKKEQTAYNIQGVPSVVVNGKYLTSGSMSGGSYDSVIKVLNHMIKLEQK